MGDDDRIYEGRGFHFQGEVSRNTSVSSFNDVGIFVAFIGNFTDILPSAGQMKSFHWFLQNSVQREALAKDYKILSQDELIMTEPQPNGIIEALQEIDEFYSSEKKKF